MVDYVDDHMLTRAERSRADGMEPDNGGINPSEDWMTIPDYMLVLASGTGGLRGGYILVNTKTGTITLLREVRKWDGEQVDVSVSACQVCGISILECCGPFPCFSDRIVRRN